MTRSYDFLGHARRFLQMSAVLVFAAFMLAMVSHAHAASDPSLHQVYEAANAGDYKAAQGMMDQVLRDHPSSAKAHFVEAELLAKQGKLPESRTEFKTAEGLDGSLSFAKPEAVQSLKALLATPPATATLQRAPAHSGPPWAVLIVGMALLGAIVFFLRARAQAPVYITAGSSGYGGVAPMNGPQPYGPQPYGPQPYGSTGSSAPGMGSTILGGLATGAAVGAGMVAGEALMHRVLDGGSHATSTGNTAFGNDLGPSDSPLGDAERRYDMGGNDFGISDASSWDDSGSSDDWS